MSYPTVLGPWFVVQRFTPESYDAPTEMEYYTSMDEETTTFQVDKKRAMLFMNLQAAARVALAEVAEVRVLTSKEDAEEFGRG